MSADLLESTPGLANLFPERWVHMLPGRVATKYEQIARREGRLCYYFAYRRTNASAPPVPVMRDLPMPHIVFTSPLTLDEIYARFEPAQHRDGDTFIHFMAAYRGRGAILFDPLRRVEPFDVAAE